MQTEYIYVAGHRTADQKGSADFLFQGGYMRKGCSAEEMKEMKKMAEMKDLLVEVIQKNDLPEPFVAETIDSCADILKEITAGLQGTVDILKALSAKRVDHLRGSGEKDLSGEENASMDSNSRETTHKEEDAPDSSDLEDGEIDPSEIYPSVVVYYPGFVPRIGTAETFMDMLDLTDPHVKEIRFKETDFLIAFHEQDVKKAGDTYYLTGLAMIYVADQEEKLRPLTCEEILKISAIIRHMETETLINGAAKPAFAVC